MSFSKTLVFALAALFIIQFSAFAGSWGNNYKAALAMAAKENKKVLLDFTGSDWCPACIQLKKDVFDTPEFQNFADKNLVLMEVDFPAGSPLSHQVKNQNDKLQEQYDVLGLPTLILLDPQGKVIKQNAGYLPGGPQAFIDWVNSGK
jgi:thioredoxin-related protein